VPLTGGWGTVRIKNILFSGKKWKEEVVFGSVLG